jgi:hypothetical protein
LVSNAPQRKVSMRIVLAGMLLAAILVSCGKGPGSSSQFDRASVAREVMSVVDSLSYHLDHLEFDQYADHHAAPGILTVAKDGIFYPDGWEYYEKWTERLKARFRSVDSSAWLNHRIYVLSPSSAVFTGRYREIIGIDDREPVEITGTWTGVFQKTDGVGK